MLKKSSFGRTVLERTKAGYLTFIEYLCFASRVIPNVQKPYYKKPVLVHLQLTRVAVVSQELLFV